MADWLRLSGKVDECKALPRGQPPPQKETHIVHVSSLLNNTFVTLTDLEGDVLTYASGGTLGLTGRGLQVPVVQQLLLLK